jgi:hypothetical protein
MTAPQDGPARKHQKRRRMRKLARWRDEQAAKAAAKKTPAKK